MRIIKFLILILTLTLVSMGFESPQEISANVPAGFFEVGTDFQIGTRWVRFINNANDMGKLSSSNNSNAIFVFNANIDMTGRTFSPISNFTGIIYGFGHTISNLRFNGNPLIASTNAGVIEWLHFENIQVSFNNSNTNALIVGTNNGTLRNVSYSLSNTTSVLEVVPPLVGSNSGTVENIVGRYQINVNHTQTNAQSFRFNGVVRQSNNSNVRNIWMQGDINVSRAGVFRYIPMPSNAGSSTQACTDSINVNVVTHGNISINLNNCYYSTQDREFNLVGQPYNQNYNADRLRVDESAINSLYLSGSSSRFSTNFWRLNDNELVIALNGRLGLAGEHVLPLRLVNNSLVTLNLYRTPVFNSELLPYNLFTSSTSPPIVRTFSEEVSYSTNYSRVLINGEPVGRGGVLRYLGDVTIELQSDYNLPSLRTRISFVPITNLIANGERSIGFIPTTSLGFIVDQNNISRNDSPFFEEGEYQLKIIHGLDESQVYNLVIRPIISGLNNALNNYTGEVTPIITASSVTINDERFFSNRSFTEVGQYDVEFPLLNSSNFSFRILPQLNFTNGQVFASPSPITISKNIEKLFINNIEIDEAFIVSNSSIVTETETQYRFTPGYGNHQIRVEGVNGFAETYRFEVEPDYSIQQNPITDHISINVTGAVLLIDNVSVPSLRANLSRVGNYVLEIKLPEDSFALNAGEIIARENLQIEPIINPPLFGTYNGSVTPNIQGEGLTVRLNDNISSLSEINQVLDKPGNYRIGLGGKDGYFRSIDFRINLIENITQEVYYNEVNIDFSSPNNIVRFNNQSQNEERFDYIKTVREIGSYSLYTRNIDGDRIFIKSFEIAPMDYQVVIEDYTLKLDVNQLHPDVKFYVNELDFNEARRDLEYTAVGRYNIRFVTKEVNEIGEPIMTYDNRVLIIEPHFSQPLKTSSNTVERYRLLNDVITFTINGREFQGSTFNENSDFFVNQNGENTIVIVGINGEIFTYKTFFENPHYSNMQSLIIPSIAVAVLSILSLVFRFLGVTRNES